MGADVTAQADHGGGVDAAVRRFGGTRAGWLDLSTGINPCPYPLGEVSAQAWTTLPDETALAALEHAARDFWQIPDGAAVLAAPGASALIARLPHLAAAGRVGIGNRTYNEHARAFAAAGWQVCDPADGRADARVIVHPNNPDGRVWTAADLAQDRVPTTVVDESFCDVMPDVSLIKEATRAGFIILKSFGKFWGLAGLRLGFAIGDPALIAVLAQGLGPWAVSGPALEVGVRALQDPDWAGATRMRLARDAQRLDALMAVPLVGGTSLFRLYDVGDAAFVQAHLARAQIWTRIFPYSTRWLRLGLPGTGADWARLEAAMAGARG